MHKKNFLEILEHETPIWLQNGWISAEHSENLLNHYRKAVASEQPDYPLALIIAGSLGALLIGGGIILVFAYNWDELSQFWRSLLSFMPLILGQSAYGYAYFKQPQSKAWAEGAGTFLMLMLASSLALISQTYHISGEPSSFLLSWTVLSIPLLYLLPATLPLLIYLCLIAAWAMAAPAEQAVGYWLLLAIAVPAIDRIIRRQPGTVQAIWAGLFLSGSLAVAWWWVWELKIALYAWMGTALLLANWYALGFWWYRRPDRQNRSILQVLAITAMLVFLYVVSFEWETVQMGWDHIGNKSERGSVSGWIQLGVWVLLLAAYIAGMLPKTRRLSGEGAFVAGFPLIVGAGVFLCRLDWEWAAIAMANLVYLLWGIYYLQAGVRSRHLPLVNAGMFVIASLIVGRFFDTDWSMLVKGVLFILIGLGFLGVNLWLSKMLRQRQD